MTATKREQSLKDIPQSISVVPGEELEQRGAQGAADIVKLVPGVNQTSTGDGPPRITIRGISSDDGTSATTGAVFGDVSFTDAYVPFVALDPNPFDLKDVEVLKGPQATLAGASNLNGAIRYVPEGPKFDTFQFRYFFQDTDIADGGFRASYGGVLNIPIGSKLALRLTGFERDQPGYVDNKMVGMPDANHLNQTGARAILGWKPTNHLRFDLTYAWQNTHLTDSSVVDNPQGNLSTSNRPRLSPNHQDYDLVDGNIKYRFDWGQIVSDSSFVRKGAENFFDSSSRVESPPPFPLDAQVYNARSTTASQELRLVSTEDPEVKWHWLFGGLLWRQRIHDELTVPLSTVALPTQVAPILNQADPGLGTLFLSSGIANVEGASPDVTVTEHALFGDLTRNLFDVLDITVGGRYYQTRSGGMNTFSGLATLATSQMPEVVIAGYVKEQGFNPKASVEWKAFSNVSLYATVSKGYRVGGIQVGAAIVPQPGNPVPNFFKSDTIWNYETGARTEFFGRTLRFDASAYLERWKSPQTLQTDSTSTSVYINNVGGVRSEGGEASVQYLFPVRGLMITASGGYSNVVTTKAFTSSSGAVLPPGSAWPLAPHWQTATTLAYALDVSRFLVTGSVTHTYLSKAIADLSERHEVYNYQEFDGLLSLKYESLSWVPELTVSVNNFLDKRGLVNEFSSPVSGAAEYTFIQPRTINIRLGGRF